MADRNGKIQLAMKTKVIFFILCFISGFFSSFAQEKKEETKEFVCPCNCTCIEMATNGVLPNQVLKSVPFDEPFMLYWKKGSAELLNGVLTIKHPKFKDITAIVNTQGDYVIAKVSDYLRPNRKYTLNFEVSIGADLETRKVVSEEMMKLSVKISDISIESQLNEAQTTAEIQKKVDEARFEIFKRLPLPAIRLIQKGTALDITTPYRFSGNDGGLFQPVNTLNRILKVDNPRLITEIKGILSGPFNSTYNLDEIGNRHGPELKDIIQKINTDESFAKKVFAGQISVINKEELASIDVIKTDKELLKKYVVNIEKLIEVMDKIGAFITIDGSLKRKFQEIKSNYEGIIKNIDSINKKLEESTKGTLVKEIFESFIINVDSDIAELQTAALAYVGADMGALLANLNDKPDSYRILPYVGMNLYFSAVNKRAPLNRIIETYRMAALLKLVSLHAGVTIPTMSSPDYQGIFNVENPKGFILGVGIRPYRAVKFNFGWLLQNRNSGNALNNSFHISSRNYFSVSLDWELRNIIPDLKGMFSK